MTLPHVQEVLVNHFFPHVQNNVSPANATREHSNPPRQPLCHGFRSGCCPRPRCLKSTTVSTTTGQDSFNVKDCHGAKHSPSLKNSSCIKGSSCIKDSTSVKDSSCVKDKPSVKDSPSVKNSPSVKDRPIIKSRSSSSIKQTTPVVAGIGPTPISRKTSVSSYDAFLYNDVGPGYSGLIRKREEEEAGDATAATAWGVPSTYRIGTPSIGCSGVCSTPSPTYSLVSFLDLFTKDQRPYDIIKAEVDESWREEFLHHNFAFLQPNVLVDAQEFPKREQTGRLEFHIMTKYFLKKKI